MLDSIEQGHVAMAEFLRSSRSGKRSNIVLIGMPGSGKSTVGKRLAKKLGMAFLDTDHLLEQVTQLQIQNIVNLRGLPYFLRVEETILSTLTCTNTIISTGGSAVYSAKAMQHLGEIGVRVYLNISLATMLRRVSVNDMRGLVKPARLPLQGLYQERKALYPAVADVVINNDGAISDLFVERLIHRLEAYVAAQ